MYDKNEKTKEEFHAVPPVDETIIDCEVIDGKAVTKKKNRTGKGKKAMKAMAIAVAFGLVAGASFEGSTYAISNLTATQTSSTASDTYNATALSSSSSSQTIANTTTTNGATVTDVSETVSAVMPSIVAITTLSQTQVQSYFGQQQTYESEGAGSGIIISEDDSYLYIATNNHVVEGATTLTVQFNDDTTVSATVQGTDADTDLAVVKVALSDITEDTKSAIKVATLGESDSLSVGESAIAIGNALGYGQSVTTGVISALNREVTLEDETTGATITNELIQTDAAINPGNSGGALLNTSGEVIGINSSKYSDTSVEGMGFAIPMSTAKPILEELIANGTIDSTTGSGAYLGVAGVDVTNEIASAYGIPVGVYLTQVGSETAAETAGLTAGEVITAFNGNEITSFDELSSQIDACNPGDTVTLTVAVSDGGEYTTQQVEVTLGEKTASQTTTETPSGSTDGNMPQQGQDDTQQGNGYSQQMPQMQQ